MAMKRKVTKAIFPVAGLGTRFLPATKSIPKEIMTLVDRPLIQYAIDEARAAGITEFIFVTSRGKGALEDYFDHAHELESSLKKAGKNHLLDLLRTTNMESGAIAYIRQHKALGLGHAVWCARELVGDEPFAVVLADDLAQFGQGRDVPVVGAHLPDNSAFSVDDADDVCLAAAPHNMVRMEPLVSLVKPPIRTDVRHGVEVQPVGAAPIFVPVGMAVYRVARLAAEPEVIEMVARQPVPHDLAVPGHLYNVFVF